TRLLMQRRRRLTSSMGCPRSTFMSDRRRSHAAVSNVSARPGRPETPPGLIQTYPRHQLAVTTAAVSAIPVKLQRYHRLMAPRVLSARLVLYRIQLSPPGV